MNVIIAYLDSMFSAYPQTPRLLEAKAELQGMMEDAYTSFIGVAYDDSALEVYPITPTQDTWDQLNDRVVQCVVTDPAGQTTGSLKGSAR